MGRFHTQFLLKPENVAEHTFGLLNILLLLTDGQVRAELLVAALQHDMGEYLSGDVPSPVKRSSAEARTAINNIEAIGLRDIYDEPTVGLSDWEYLLLKTADSLDGLFKCYEERQMGNYSLTHEGDPIGDNYALYLESQLPALGGGPAAEVVRAALHQWHWRE